MSLQNIAEDLHPFAVPIDSIDFMDKNPRTHSDEGQEAIQKSLARFGQVKPVVLASDARTVIAGNGTLQAARALGWTHIAVVKTRLEGGEAKAYAIADNRTTDLSAFDMDVVEDILKELDDDDLLDATGFLDDFDDEDDDESPESPETAGPPETVQPGQMNVSLNQTGVQRSEGETEDEGSTTEATRSQTYRYNIVFENLSQQEQFYDWMRQLKGRYPDLDSAAARLLAFAEEHPIEESDGDS